MISLDDESYIVGMWFSSCPKTENNWLACVVRDPKKPKAYKGWSRFRYVKDNNVFDSDDEKSWTTFDVQENTSQERIIEILRQMQDAIKEGYPDMDEIIVKGGLKKLIPLAKGKPWMNIETHPLQ